MKDATNYILSEFYRVLGSLSYEGNPVSVFSLEQDSSDSDSLFVRIYTSYLTDQNTKTNFGSKVYINLDIVNRLSGGVRTEKNVNAVADLIGQVIIPTPSTTGIASNSDFAIINVKSGGPSTNFNDRSNTDLIVRKVLTFEVSIQQL